MSKVVAMLVVAAVAACGPTGPIEHPVDPDKPVDRVVMEPIVLEAVLKDGEITVEAYDAALLFDEAFGLYAAGEFTQALELYERVLEQFPKTVLAPPAMFNLALCHEKLGEIETAARIYDELIAKYPDAEVIVDAMFRRGYCLEHLGNLDEAVSQYSEVLAIEDVSGEDVLEAMARIGHNHFVGGDIDEAEKALTMAVLYYVQQSQIERFENAFYAGQAQYDLAELWRSQFEDVLFSTDEAEIREQLDEKLASMVEASDAYVLAIKIGNFYWAVASGYQVGLLLRTLYDDMMEAPVPPELDTDELVETYYGYLQEYIQPLLERAISVWEKTLLMAERVGIECEWVDLTDQALTETRGMLAELLIEDEDLAPSPDDGDAEDTQEPGDGDD